MELRGTPGTHLSRMDCFSDRCHRYFSVRRVECVLSFPFDFVEKFLFKNNNPHSRLCQIRLVESQFHLWAGMRNVSSIFYSTIYDFNIWLGIFKCILRDADITTYEMQWRVYGLKWVATGVLYL